MGWTRSAYAAPQGVLRRVSVGALTKSEHLCQRGADEAWRQRLCPLWSKSIVAQIELQTRELHSSQSASATITSACKRHHCIVMLGGLESSVPMSARR